MKKVTLILTLIICFSCSTDDCGDCPVTPEEMLARMQAIDAEIDAMLSTSCGSGGTCMATAYGSKACGGPVKYIVHSTNMDMIRFNSLVNEYTELNKEYNIATEAISDCSLPGKPIVECVSGNCEVAGF